MTYTVTQEDRDAALELWHTLLAIGPNVETYSDGVKVGKAFQQTFARHRIETLEQAAEVAKEYATIGAIRPAPGWPQDAADWWETGVMDGANAIAAAIRNLKGKSDE